VAANDLCSQTINFGELTTCLLTLFAERPYKIKMTSVMAIKTTLRRNISNSGDEVSGETKRGKKARKNIDSFGLRILSKNPLSTICPILAVDDDELNLIAPVSRHIDQAR
jgi:hypothetical protein